jgi:hypothetical protein
MSPCIIWQQPQSAGEKLELFTDKLLKPKTIPDFLEFTK